MSKIQDELCKVADVAPKRGEDRQEFLKRLLKAVNKLSDADFDKLSEEAGDWANAAADAINAKKDKLPDFPDYQEEAPARRRASSDEDGKDAAPTGTKEIEPEDVKEGQALRIITKRGKDVSGTVVEVTKKLVAIKLGNGDEEEFDFDRIDKLIVAAESGGSSSRRRRSDDGDEGEGPAEPKIEVGVEVKVVTKRGKEETGKVVELTESIIVLDNGDEEVEFSMDRVESVTPVGKPAPARRRSASDEDGKDAGKDAESAGKSRASNPAGVSVGTRIKELLADNPDATEEEIGAKLKKEGISFKENTLSLNYKDAKTFLGILKSKGLLKK